ELSTQNKIALCDALAEFVAGDLPLDVGDTDLDKEELIGESRATALEAIAEIRARWQWILDNLDTPLAEAEPAFSGLGIAATEFTNRAADPVLFHRLQDYSIRVSWKAELKPRLDHIFD